MSDRIDRSHLPSTTSQDDPWAELRQFTSARLALGRAGHALPTRELLRFGLAHAQARDAVHVPLDVSALEQSLQALNLATLRVRSAAPDRASYLLRPDLGRRLANDDVPRLRDWRERHGHAYDLLIVIGDGLSSPAVARNAAPLVDALTRQAPPGWRLGPVVIATQARVALADDVGQQLGAPRVAMLIGERPGLSSPDSLGIYLTHDPRVGRHDAQRNCISNVRPEGLAPELAARRLWWLCEESRRLGLTGVALKDRSDELQLPGGDATALPA